MIDRADGTVPVSVVIPTVGRASLLRRCLASIAACRPLPDEILVVDQSRSDEVARLVSDFAAAGARLVECRGRGVSRGRNVGIAAAGHELVLVTDDDCTVDAAWVGTARSLARAAPSAIVTGRVLPVGDARAVPSTRDDPRPAEFAGSPRTGVLFPNNMVVPRSTVLALGGFDERFGPEEAAEDNDFCYRWLKAGYRIRYEPALVVWHHDWRTPAELERMYVNYARGEGFLYAKHLRAGDLRILRFIARDLYWASRGLLSALVKRRERWTDSRRAIFRGLPEGFWRGWRAYKGGSP